MRYADLKAQTAKLSVGRHRIYEREPDAVFVENVGQRHPSLPERDIFRLVIRWSGRDLTVRHADLFHDLLLKMEARPELRLSLLETCEQIANGAAPSQLFEQRQFSRTFQEQSDAESRGATSIARTAGLPTELFLCALQGLILVYDRNEPDMNAPEVFRHAFTRLEAGDSFVEVMKRLAPQTPAGKRYYDLSKRS
ncbi:MAG: hypothetical protein V1784_07950 [bacterium]